MAWSIEFEKRAEKELYKLDAPFVDRLVKFLDRLAFLDDPRSIGEALSGSQLGSYWKYRVGAYRIIADIQDSRLRILVVRLGNRRDIYRK